MTLKKSMIGSKQLDLTGNPVKTVKVWNIRPLYSLYGTKGEKDKALPHINKIPTLVDITDFYEPFAGAASITRIMGNEGRLHDDLTLHLNDGNKLNYHALKAVKEEPEELIEAIQNLLPELPFNGLYSKEYMKNNTHGIDNTLIDTNTERFTLYSDGRVKDKELNHENENNLFKALKEADHSTYNLEAIAATFYNMDARKKAYYMFNGENNIKDIKLVRSSQFYTKHIWEGTTIKKFSELLNHYNTELTCKDYKDMEFKNPETSYLYCDSPYSNGVAQSSPEINMDEYTTWLNELNNQGYKYTVSCNNACIKGIFNKIKTLNNQATINYTAIRTRAGQTGTIDDGVLTNWIE